MPQVIYTMRPVVALITRERGEGIYLYTSRSSAVWFYGNSTAVNGLGYLVHAVILASYMRRIYLFVWPRACVVFINMLLRFSIFILNKLFLKVKK